MSLNEGWLEFPISKISDVVLGGTPRRAEPSFWNGSITWAAAKDIAQCPTKHVKETQETITEEGLQKSNTKLLPKGTIVITARGTVGEIRLLGESMAFNQTCYGLIPKNESIDNDFLYYALKNAVREMKALSYGTVFETITTRTFDELTILIPPLLQQRRIAEILSSLDDKIELNYEMNKTLEVIAQAIFKHWFVDFEPFREALVHNEEVDKEIPQGWEVVELNKALSLEYGKGLPERKRKPGNIPAYGSNGIVGCHNKALVKGPGIVVGRKGTAGSVLWSHTDFFPIDTTFYVVPKGKVTSMVYLYFELMNQHLTRLVADSAVPGLNRNIAYLNKTVIPPENLIRRFDVLVMPLFEMIHNNTREIRALEQMRDTLLPKLLSGEIRVNVEEGFQERELV